jgi:ATP-dependent helicase/nuclease subunit A
MPGLGFTREQKRAIETRGVDLLVSAAAGSGKTAVLVERVFRLITNDQKPVDIDRLLVVTFTEAAASEMKRRVADLLAQKRAEEPGDAHLARQANLLPLAHISTIHAFCRKMMKRYFYLADLDPEFKVGDEAELRLIQSQALEDLFEEEYGREDNDAFIDLVESYGGAKTRHDAFDNELRELVLRLYEFTDSVPYPEHALRQYAERFDVEPDGLDSTAWARILKEEIRRELESALAAADRAEYYAALPGGPEKYRAALESDRRQILFLLELAESSLTDLDQALQNIYFERIYAYRGKAAESISDALKTKVKALRDTEIKGRLEKIRDEFFFQSPRNMARDIERLRPAARALTALTLQFRQKYAEAKKERNLVDFGDMEHFCIEILLEGSPEHPVPSQAARELSTRFTEILIDEYQDSNAAQEMILWAIAGKAPGNRFMVGDVKQSVYQFRQADPQIFMDKYEHFAPASEPEKISTDSLGLRIDLSQNFRSRESVIHTVNFFFSQLMTKEMGGAAYDSAAALYPGAEYPSIFGAYNTEIHLVEYRKPDPEELKNFQDTQEMIEEMTKAAAEAKVIGQRVLYFVEGANPLMVMDSRTKSPRPCRCGDIVILVRSLGAAAETLTEELKNLNIKAYTGSGTAFFETVEIMTALSFLQIIDNPRQDIHLITVLHSPVYALTPDELLEIRLADKDGAFDDSTFYACLIRYLDQTPDLSDEQNSLNASARQTLTAFLADLWRWRDLAVYTPISELLSIVYVETGYYDLAGAAPGGGLRQANLRALLDRAAQYETTAFKGLFHFIRWMDRLRGTRAGETLGGRTASTESEDFADTVRIMTIHKSKGLEFPVVFVSMLGRQFNRTDERKNVILHPEMGFGPVYVNTKQRTKTETLPRFSLAKKIRLESLSEELRVLYVAMTRAKEKLVLTGCVDKLAANIEKWCAFIHWKETALPAYYRAGCQRFLDFIMPCLARHKDGAVLREMADEPLISGQSSVYDAPARFEIMFSAGGAASAVQREDIETSDQRLDALRTLRAGQNHSGQEKEIRAKIWRRYPFEDQKNLPSKISISEVKRLFYAEMFQDSAALERATSGNLFPPPLFRQKERAVSSARRGTAIHTVLEHLDPHTQTDEQSVRALLDSLTARNLLAPEDRAVIPAEKIVRFVHSALAERIRRSPSVTREAPFVMGLRESEIYSKKTDGGETILVHGVIDCFFEEDGEIVLVDYKSDYVNEKALPDLIGSYRIQLDIYRKAIERSTQKKVKETLIYFLAADLTIDTSKF